MFRSYPLEDKRLRARRGLRPPGVSAKASRLPADGGVRGGDLKEISDYPLSVIVVVLRRRSHWWCCATSRCSEELPGLFEQSCANGA